MPKPIGTSLAARNGSTQTKQQCVSALYTFRGMLIKTTAAPPRQIARRDEDAAAGRAQEPQRRPSISTERTCFSMAARSVSSSHGLTSRMTMDLLTARAGWRAGERRSSEARPASGEGCRRGLVLSGKGGDCSARHCFPAFEKPADGHGASLRVCARQVSLSVGRARAAFSAPLALASAMMRSFSACEETGGNHDPTCLAAPGVTKER